MRLPISDQLAI